MSGSQLINQATTRQVIAQNTFASPFSHQSRAISTQSINPDAHTSISSIIRGSSAGAVNDNSLFQLIVFGVDSNNITRYWGSQLGSGSGAWIPRIVVASSSIYAGQIDNASPPFAMRIVINKKVMSLFFRNSSTPFYTSNPTFGGISEVFVMATSAHNLLYFTDCIIQRHS